MKFFAVVPFIPIILSISIYADDRFIKRYALMKMYESCFGPEAVKEVRKEMKTALGKCSGVMPAATSYSSNAHQNVIKTPIFASFLQKHHSDNPYSSEHLKSQSASHVDLNKLQQAILTGYHKHLIQPTSYSSSITMNGGMAFPHPRPWNYPAPGSMYPYPHANNLLPPQPSATGFMPSYYPLNPFAQSAFFSPYYGTGRSSRDLDVKGQLESLAVRISGRIKNVTCIMQELGYLNDNLEPDYQKIVERVKKLSIPDDLKNEMVDSVEYCKQFSLCVPEDSKDKFSKDMIKPMFFFRCYKHKKMEACIIKDIKDRYSSDEVDENMIGMERTDRKHELNNNDFAELALYEFLYGADSFDVDDII